MIKPILLWTDALVFILVTTIILSALYVRKKEHLRAPWRQVFRSRIGLAAMVVLMLYVLIGLLDSMHYQQAINSNSESGEVHYSADVPSLLDYFMAPIKETEEKTYSAPFATHAYSRETVQLDNGEQARIYPRLKFGGAHLDNPERDWFADIVGNSVSAMVQGLLLWTVVVLLLVAWIAARQSKGYAVTLQDIIKGRSEIPWRTMFVSLGLLIVLIVWCADSASQVLQRFHDQVEVLE